ncbi:MAG: DUF6492 family protein [Pseudomonadota bacterium]
MISKVISVCCFRDSATWQVASHFIVKNIPAAVYEVVVPDHEVEQFRAATASAITVVPESHYLKERTLGWLKSRFPSERAFRAGWYLQQFIKVEAVRQGAPDDLMLIWDADTVPLKPLSFNTGDGKVVYYRSDEHHLSYFETIKKMLDMDKIVDFSFIAQCFAVKAGWAQAFVNEIETRNGMHWVDAVLKHIDYEDGCSFSEYESMGTWLTHRHLDEMCLNNAQWQRLGNALIGNIGKLTNETAAELSKKYDFISFESWDHGQIALSN